MALNFRQRAEEWLVANLDKVGEGIQELSSTKRRWDNTIQNLTLSEAAYEGDEDLCRLALDKGASNYDEMLAQAARGGHEVLCKLALDKGASNYDEMLACAKKGGHEVLCHLAESWCAKNTLMDACGS